MMTETPSLPPGVDLRVLGGKSPEWARGYRFAWEKRNFRSIASVDAVEFLKGYREGKNARDG